jgi:hypothetical protein
VTHLSVKRALAATSLASLLLVSATAFAADAPGKGKGKVLKLDEINVEGKIQKPQAFYILPRSNLNYSALDREESFLPKIKKATQSEPF